MFTPLDGKRYLIRTYDGKGPPPYSSNFPTIDRVSYSKSEAPPGHSILFKTSSVLSSVSAINHSTPKHSLLRFCRGQRSLSSCCLALAHYQAVFGYSAIAACRSTCCVDKVSSSLHPDPSKHTSTTSNSIGANCFVCRDRNPHRSPSLAHRSHEACSTSS